MSRPWETAIPCSRPEAVALMAGNGVREALAIDDRVIVSAFDEGRYHHGRAPCVGKAGHRVATSRPVQ